MALIIKLVIDCMFEQWIAETIKTTVHLNDSHANATYTIPKWKPLEKITIPFSLPKAPPVTYKKKDFSIAEQILQVLFLKSIRRGPKHLIAPFINEIKSLVEHSIERNQPIPLVLPSLPFKDQSPFGTGAGIDHADLGEYCYFAQIKRLLDAIKAVYEKGAHLTLLCDGLLFSDIFVGGDINGPGRYKARCEAIKNAYGLYNDVSLIDMKEILFHEPEWVEQNEEIKTTLKAMHESFPMVQERIDHLTHRFLFYVQLPNMSYEQARDSLGNGLLKEPFLSSFRRAAIEYAAIHLTFKKLCIIEKRFPHAVRCTVHPKSAPQLPLHMTNKKNVLLPYNGVPVVSRQSLLNGKSLFESARIRRLYEVFLLPQVQAVYLENDASPFYYEVP